MSVCCAERWSCSSAHRENRELPYTSFVRKTDIGRESITQWAVWVCSKVPQRSLLSEAVTVEVVRQSPIHRLTI